MSEHQEFLQNLYDAFNKREIETIISTMRSDVKWANGLEGGFVYGRDAVREYWIEQFKAIQPELETLKFETDEKGRSVVTVHQIVKDLHGNVLADTTVRQIFTVENGLISLYEIGETETIREMIEKTKNTGERRMSEKHKAILLEGNAAIARGDNEGFLRFCADDTEWTFVGNQTLKGKEAVRRYMAEAYLEPPKFTVENLIAEGEYLTAVGKITLKDAGGKEIHYSYCDVWRFRADEIVELKGFVIETEVK